jgi:ribonuclease inhibitor
MHSICIDGSNIDTVDQFHDELVSSGLFPDFYGRKYYALRDSLSGLVELPLTIAWTNSTLSKARLGDAYDRLVTMMRHAESETSGRFRLEVSG